MELMVLRRGIDTIIAGRLGDTRYPRSLGRQIEHKDFFVY